MNKVHALALVGVVGCASGALGQVIDQTVSEQDVAIVHFGQSAGGYSSRALTDVFSVGTPSQTGGAWASGGTVAYDDVTFPQGVPFPIMLVRASMAVNVGINPPDPLVYARILFYPNHDSTVAPTARPYSGTPVVWNLGSQHGGGSVSPVALGSNVFTFPGDRICGVYIELFSDAAMTMYADDRYILRRANLPGSLLIGSSDAYGWFGPTTGASAACIDNADRSGGTAANNRATYLVLTAGHPATCNVDFNQDGDVGTDADIESFFSCLAGNCCPTCLPNADFNGDGDVGTDADIESFFRVLAGGAC